MDNEYVIYLILKMFLNLMMPKEEVKFPHRTPISVAAHLVFDEDD